MLLLLLALVACGGASLAPSESTTPPEAAVALTTTELHVEGMTCDGCADTIREALQPRAGIVRVEVDVEGKKAVVSHDATQISPQDVAAAITAAGYPASLGGADVPAAADAPFGIDPEAAKVCEAGCAAQFDYDPADVVTQPGAKVGDLTRCPVSGVVFVVEEDQPHYEVDGKTWYTCCGMCMEKLQAKPGRFIRM